MILLLEDKHQVEQLINSRCHSSAVTEEKWERKTTWESLME